MDGFVQFLFISCHFQEGMPIFLIWAYHSSSDVQFGQFARHSFRGLQQVTLIPAATPTTTTGKLLKWCGWICNLIRKTEDFWVLLSSCEPSHSCLIHGIIHTFLRLLSISVTFYRTLNFCILLFRFTKSIQLIVNLISEKAETFKLCLQLLFNLYILPTFYLSTMATITLPGCSTAKGTRYTLW